MVFFVVSIFRGFVINDLFLFRFIRIDHSFDNAILSLIRD